MKPNERFRIISMSYWLHFNCQSLYCSSMFLLKSCSPLETFRQIQENLPNRIDLTVLWAFLIVRLVGLFELYACHLRLQSITLRLSRALLMNPYYKYRRNLKRLTWLEFNCDYYEHHINTKYINAKYGTNKTRKTLFDIEGIYKKHNTRRSPNT